MATLTANKNYLSPTGFHLKINSLRFPNLEYFATTITLPQITLEEQALPYKTVDYAAPGTRLSFGDLSITAQITEDFDNYLETYNWMHDIAASKGKGVKKEEKELNIFDTRRAMKAQELEEKMAKKDHDGDGKLESGKDVVFKNVLLVDEV